MSDFASLPPDERMFIFDSRFARPNPVAIQDWLQNDVPDGEWRTAANALGWRWLRLLVPAMSEPHALSESPHFYILTLPKVDEVKRMLRFLEETRVQVLRALASAAPPSDRPKHIVVVCGRREDYDELVATESSVDERDLADSGGMFFSQGFSRIALPSATLTDFHATVVHELVHDCVAHLPLPMWLNEGVTQMLEYELVSWRPFHLDREVMKKHASHWTAETIQEFWSGRAFSLPGDSQMLSYNLAVVLVRKIMGEVAYGPEDFWAFVREAKAGDAGDVALRAQFEVSLEEVVSDFLGPGPWTPRLENCVE